MSDGRGRLPVPLPSSPPPPPPPPTLPLPTLQLLPETPCPSQTPSRPDSVITSAGPFFKSSKLTLAAARQKKQKLPDCVAAILPESTLYTQLLEFESRVDSALAQKKIDIQEALKNPPFVQRTLRIYVFNTFANQGGGGTEPPSWSLKVMGRILEDGVEIESVGAFLKPKPMFPKFTIFLKRVVVTLDPALYRENPIVWENSRGCEDY